MTSTGLSEWRTTLSVTVPISQRPIPDRPCVLMMTKALEVLLPRFMISALLAPPSCQRWCAGLTTTAAIVRQNSINR